MSEDEAQMWKQSGYPHEARDVIEAQDVMMAHIREKLRTLDPATLTAEQAQGVIRWLTRQTDEPDFRKGIPLVYEHMKELAVLLNDQELLRRILWSMDAFQQWLQRLHDEQMPQ
jgi:tRNA-dihydrouridine synthase